ncbi:MAG: hypothetical protein FWD65_07780 [Coriobacteriia bacterium]|nr:hypothetical protein [Coriobacteriia bacterium]
MKTAFSLLAMACSLSGAVVYVISVLKRRARPQRITWLLWAILGVVYLLAAIRSHGNVLYTFASFMGPCLIFLLALKFGTGGTSKLDIISLVVAVFALVLLAFTRGPMISLLLCLFVDAIGAALTIIKILHDRSSEPKFTWLLSASGGGFALLGLHDYHLVNLLFPAYILILGMITFILVKPQHTR